MATILLSAAGAAIGSSIGGSVLGLSMTAVGRFIGASIGRSLDQRLLGTGSEAVETGKIDRFRLTGAGEGAPIAQVKFVRGARVAPFFVPAEMWGHTPTFFFRRSHSLLRWQAICKYLNPIQQSRKNS